MSIVNYKVFAFDFPNLGPVYMEWGTPVQWGKFLLFSRSGGHKTKESYPTRPGSPTPCKQALSDSLPFLNQDQLVFESFNQSNNRPKIPPLPPPYPTPLELYISLQGGNQQEWDFILRQVKAWVERVKRPPTENAKILFNDVEGSK